MCIYPWAHLCLHPSPCLFQFVCVYICLLTLCLCSLLQACRYIGSLISSSHLIAAVMIYTVMLRREAGLQTVTRRRACVMFSIVRVFTSVHTAANQKLRRHWHSVQVILAAFILSPVVTDLGLCHGCSNATPAN